MARFKKFFGKKSFSGLGLIGASLLALFLRNSIFRDGYEGLLFCSVPLEIGNFLFDFSLIKGMNGGVMTLFFLLVGLELKREILEGDLSFKAHRFLPMIAALGGVVFPAAIYLFFTRHSPQFLTGWAIPTATDITFSLSILALLGPRIPSGVRASLLSLAIVDDILAILIVSFFYTKGISLLWGVAALFSVALLFLGRKKGLTFLLSGGLLLWGCFGLAGIPPTLAGVITAFFVPLGVTSHTGEPQSETERDVAINIYSPLKRLEKKLHPLVTFVVLPLFAFFNGGVLLKGLGSEVFFHPVTQGCFFGLLLGKPLGIMAFAFGACKLGFCGLPHHVSWSQYGGMAMIAGIGFTMSLYIGRLSFGGGNEQEAMRLGIFFASILSAIFGCLWLYLNTVHRKRV